MKNNHFGTSFLITTLFYIVLTALFFYFQTKSITLSEKPQEKSIKIALSQFVPEPVQEKHVEPKEEEEVVPEPVKEEPEPIVEPEHIKPVPKPIKKVTVVKKKPKPKIKKKREKKVKKKIVKNKKAKKTKKTKKTKISKPKSRVSKSKFMGILRSKIERNKSYPRMAERRGMQGSVRVRFTILPNGHVSSISMSGPKVFRASAKKAIKRAFPINVKDVPFSLPSTVSLTLRYRLAR